MKKSLYLYVSFLVLGLSLFFIINSVFAWSLPTQNPPYGDLPAPLDTSSVEQTKAGNLNLDNNLKVGGLLRLGLYTSHPTGTNGNLYYNTSDHKFYGYQGGAWKELGGGAGFWLANGDNIYNTNTGNVGIGTTAPGQKLDVSGGNIRTTGQLISTVASGTAPLSVASNTVVANLNADLLDGQQNSYYDQRQYTRSDNYLGGYYVSGGSEKPNNAIFGAGKLKLAMLSGSNLGFGGSWNDVLWLSAYTGGDVKSSHALVFDKYSSNVYVSDQNFDSASWGTGYKLWHDGNDGSGSGLDADMIDGQHYSSAWPNPSNMVTGSGTSNYLSKWTGTYTQGNSLIYDNGTNVGIGTTTPGEKLEVANGNLFINNGENATIQSSAHNLIFAGVGYNHRTYTFKPAGSTSGATHATIAIQSADATPTYTTKVLLHSNGNSYFNGGNVGIGTTAPAQKLHVAGNVQASAFYYSSDISLKENIKPIENSLEKIMKLQGVSFNWKDNGDPSIGLIAQEVEEIFPEVVITDQNTGLKSIDYGNLVGVLIEAIKEQQNQINELQTKINSQ